MSVEPFERPILPKDISNDFVLMDIEEPKPDHSLYPTDDEDEDENMETGEDEESEDESDEKELKDEEEEKEEEIDQDNHMTIRTIVEVVLAIIIIFGIDLVIIIVATHEATPKDIPEEEENKIIIMDYTPPNLNLSYASNDSIYTNHVMNETVFKLSRIFLDSLFPNNLIPDEIMDQLIDDPSSAEDIFIKGDNAPENWRNIVESSPRFVVSVVVGLFFTVAMILFGFVWCCARSCCCSRKRSSPGDGCSLAIEMILMLVMIILATLSMAWYFSANNFTLSGLDNLPDNVDTVLGDFDLFLGNTAEEVNHLNSTNIGELRNNILDDIENITDKIGDIAADLELQELVDIVGFFADTTNEFVNNIEPQLLENLKNVNNDLTDLSTNIINLGSIIGPLCSIPTPPNWCNGLAGQIDSLRDGVLALKDVIPADLSGISQNIDQALVTQINDLHDNLQEGMNALTNFTIDDKMFDDLQTAISDNLKEIIDPIKDAQNSVKDFQKSLHTDNIIFDMTIYDFKDYFQYIYYGFLVFGLFLVFILAFYLLGTLMGTCGSVDGPSRKTGACCLCTGTVIFFIFGFFLWLIATVFFTVGSLNDHLVCKLLEDPSDSELGGWLDQVINNQLNSTFDTPFNMTLSGILEDCRNDETAYEAFHISNIYDIGNWEADFDIHGAIEDIKNQVQETIETELGNIKLDDSLTGLQAMVDTVDQLIDQIINKVVDISIDSYLDQNEIDALNNTIYNDIPDVSDKDTIVDNWVDILTGIDNIESDITKTQDLLKNLNETLSFNDGETTIGDLLKTAIQKSQAAIDSLQTGGQANKDIFELIDSAAGMFIDTVDEFVSFVVNNFARCGPVAQIYDLFDNTLCYQIFQPFNGLWTGLGLYLILMFPILILSCLLEPLFRRHKDPVYSKDNMEMSTFNPQAQQHPQQNVVYIQPIPESYRGAQNRNR